MANVAMSVPDEPRLPPGQQLVAADKWPIIGERQPAPQSGEWRLAVAGEVAGKREWSLAELQQFPVTERTLDLHCVTRWSKYDVTFRGVRLRDLLAACEVHDTARFVSFVAHSSREHSTSLPLAEALALDTLIAWEANGEPLAASHGGPLRNIVPRKYFYKSVKWLKRMDLLAEDRLGYWEAETGYHNGADPWLEERYMAPQLDRRMAARLIASRDFSGQDLRSIDARQRDLRGLNAAEALLRDAHFERCDLRDANFRRANLSNAHFGDANLQGADFTEGDLEGANLAGADLRGANLSDCSLIGASFCEPSSEGGVQRPARFDAATQWNGVNLDVLTEFQREFIEAHRPRLE